MVERRMAEDGSMMGERLADGSLPPLTFGTGRVCLEPECCVHLSRYNSTEWCALHECPGSTGRPYDTSTRPKGRRRNSRRRSASRV